MRDRELENLPAVIAEAERWEMTGKQVDALVKRISVRGLRTMARILPHPLRLGRRVPAGVAEVGK
jgi:hypothetical protein